MLTKSKGRFKELFQKKKKALMPYVCFGYPTVPKSEKIMRTLLENGADALEIGFPFSDPVADGPLLTAANHKALKQKIELNDFFDSVKSLRQQGFTQPITLMSYYNVIFQVQKEEFAKNFKKSEVDALLIPDVPFEEIQGIDKSLKELPKAFLIGLNTPKKTIIKLASLNPEYFYLVSKFGVTGTGKTLDPRIGKKIMEITGCSNVPIAVGFGISSKKQLLQINASGIIIGSLFTHSYNLGGLPKLRQTIKKLV